MPSIVYIIYLFVKFIYQSGKNWRKVNLWRKSEQSNFMESD